MAPSLLPAQSAAAGMGLQWLSSALDLAALASRSHLSATGRGALTWSGPPRFASSMPGADASSVGIARDFTVATLRRWGIGERAEDVSIVVSELVTNALRHALPHAPDGARWPVRLGLLQPGSCVLCMVADPSEHPPVRRTDGCMAEGGRGLHIIEALSEEWGFSPLNLMGKVVWARFTTECSAKEATCRSPELLHARELGRHQA